MTNPMCVEGTPVEYYPELGLWVKREDQCCPGGPNFSKTRGVYAHVAARPEPVIGVLDTYHSQGGWAVARACQLLGKQCVLYYPVRKADRETGLDWNPTGRGQWGDVLREPQLEADKLGAALIPLQAGRSAVLYHAAKKDLASETAAGESYFMPNALKLPEMITETVAEVERTIHPDALEWAPKTVIVSASSGTIAAGVLRGFIQQGWRGRFVVHQGYSRSEVAIKRYMEKIADRPYSLLSLGNELVFVDEGYAYGDTASAGPLPPFPCNEFYDLKAFRWWMSRGRERFGEALLWNIG